MRGVEQFLGKWYYVHNPNGGYVFLKYGRIQVNGQDVLTQVLLGGNKMMDGVYFIDDYELEKKAVYHLKQYSFDVIILGDSKEMLREELIEEGYVTREEFDRYYGSETIPPNTEEIIFVQ